LLSAHRESLAHFPELHSLLPEQSEQGGEHRKTLFAAETFYPNVWIERAPARALLFPQIEARDEHALERLPAPEALRMLLPNAVEQWDREMISQHLSLLRKLTDQAPAFRLKLAPDIRTLPETVTAALNTL
jgi:hypothetical protein